MIEDQYIDKIVETVENSTIESKELKDDLIDHFCCLVELDMKRGMSFDQSFANAFKQTCPNGLNEIQRETFFLFNYSKIMLMKRVTYVIGFLSSIVLTTGMLFRLLHLPGADMLSMFGVMGLLFLFLPLIFANRYKRAVSQVASDRYKWRLGMISASFFGIATVFELLHWPGAGIILGISFLIFSLGFLPFLFFRMYSKSLEEL